MLPPVRALSNLEPLRHYYLIYVNEALMGAPATNSLLPSMALVAFFIPALCVAPRLHHALIYQNYPLK
jgi:ABC-2 type transport system permease protein